MIYQVFYRSCFFMINMFLYFPICYHHTLSIHELTQGHAGININSCVAHFPPTLNLCIIHFLSLLPTRQMIRKFGFDQTSATQGGLSSNAMSINIKDISVTLTRAFRIWKFEIRNWILQVLNQKLYIRKSKTEIRNYEIRSWKLEIRK